MITPTLENNRVKLVLLGMSNYEHLLDIAAQKHLIQYSPSKIDTPADLKNYIQLAVDGYYHKTIIPFYCL